MSTKEARQVLIAEINDLKKRRREAKAELSQREAMLKIVELMSQRASSHIANRRTLAETAIQNIISSCDSSLWPQKMAMLHLATIEEFMGGFELVSTSDWSTPLFHTAQGSKTMQNAARMLMELYQPRRGFPKLLIKQVMSRPVIYFSYPAR